MHTLVTEELRENFGEEGGREGGRGNAFDSEKEEGPAADAHIGDGGAERELW